MWRPYQKAIKHRSIWSHGPIIGTIGRILYLGLWVSLFGLIYLEIAHLSGYKTYTERQLLAMFQQSIASNYPVYLALFCGLELGAMSHYSSDWLVSTFNRLANRGNRSPALDRQKKMPVKQARKVRINK
jgi:uncharacterized metal-binding protein